MTKAKALLLPLLLLSAPAAADPVEDGQLWASVSASGPIDGRLLAQGESITRFGNDINRLYQQEAYAGLGYKFSDQVSLYGGYGIIVDFLENKPNRTEHRPYQALNLNLGKIVGGTLSGRTRLEERFIEGADDMGIRLRQQLRYVHPLSGKLSAFGSAEFFFSLNDTDWGQHSGFDRWRLSAGLRHPIGKKLNLELGYLNQYAAKYRATNTMDHVLTTTLAVSF
jgi:hypothetical protein